MKSLLPPRFAILLLALVLVASACGASDDTADTVAATAPAATATSAPTAVPTAEPTATVEPTVAPTPTAVPTATAEPTPEPTATSTPEPTEEPTETPTEEPTAGSADTDTASTDTGSTDTGSTDGDEPGPVASTLGASTFAAACASCHGADGQGTADGPGLLGIGQFFTTDATPITNLVTNGGTNMPEFGSKLTADEIDAVVQYVVETFQ